MRNFILKGHICSSDSLDNLCIYENAYVVCKEGKTEGTGSFEKGYSFDAVVLDDSSLPHP